MEIMNFKQINRGCLIARFDVRIPSWGLTIRGCSYFEKDGKRWFGMPSSRIENKDGSVKNYEHILFDKGTRMRLDTACLEKIKSGQYQTKQEQHENKIPF